MEESFLNIRQDYGVLPRTLLNSITDDLMRVFGNFGKLTEKNVVEFLFIGAARM